MTIEERITLEVGPLSDKERAYLLGRKSAIRERARAQGIEHLLPAPPPIEEDVTLQDQAESVVRRLHRLKKRGVRH